MGEAVGADLEPASAVDPIPDPTEVAPSLCGELPEESSLELPDHLLRLGDLFLALEPVAPEQVALTLAGSAAARLAGRAAFLGLLLPAQAVSLGLERDWQALLRVGLDASQLALLVMAEPWLPPVHLEEPFCRWLVNQGVITQKRLEALHRSSIELGWPIFQVALEQAVLDESAYVELLARFSGLAIARAPRGFSRSDLVGFPVGWVEYFDLVPLENEGGGRVIAVARPLPAELLDRIEADAGTHLECRLAAPADIAAWRRRWLRHWWRLHFPGRGGLSDG